MALGAACNYPLPRWVRARARGADGISLSPETYSVRPEPVEGFTKKSSTGAAPLEQNIFFCRYNSNESS